MTSKLITLAIHFVQFKSVETTMTEHTSKNTSSYYPEVSVFNYIPIILVFHLWVPGGGVEAVLILGDQIVRCKVNADPFRNISRA